MRKCKADGNVHEKLSITMCKHSFLFNFYQTQLKIHQVCVCVCVCVSVLLSPGDSHRSTNAHAAALVPSAAFLSLMQMVRRASPAPSSASLSSESPGRPVPYVSSYTDPTHSHLAVCRAPRPFVPSLCLCVCVFFNCDYFRNSLCKTS